MTDKQLMERIVAMLDKFESRLTEVEWQERHTPHADASPAYLKGQRECLTLICVDLESLIIEWGRAGGGVQP